MSKIFKDGIKTSPNNNSMKYEQDFQNFRGVEKRGKTVTLHFDDAIICLILSALKMVYKQVAYLLLIGGGEISGYSC